MLSWSVNQNKCIAIRYPRGEVPARKRNKPQSIELAQYQDMSPEINENIDILIFAVGNFVWPSVTLAEDIQKETNKSVKVINLRFIKPLNVKELAPIIEKSSLVCIIEDGSQIGGSYHYILNQFKHLNKPLNEWLSFAIPDRFIDHGSVNQLRQEINLLPNQIKDEMISASNKLLHA